MIDFIGKKYIFLGFSGVLIVASIGALAWWGLHFGIDFTGGALLHVEFSDARPETDQVRGALGKSGITDAVIQPIGERGILMRFKSVDEKTHQEMVAHLRVLVSPSTVKELRFDAIGPTIGRELKIRSLFAILFAIVAIVLYVAWAFRKVSLPVASWKYGVATIAALVHDVTIPVGVFALLGHFRGVEIDGLFVSALLTVLGFSVHDTIVVFDRIRENLRKGHVQESYEVTVNRSLNETMARSINTSLTVLLVLVAVYFFGGVTTKYFSLTLIIGIIFGTYSSIFIASPLLVVWHQFSRSRDAR